MKNTIYSEIEFQTHLVQTEIWNKFKKSYGTKVENFENLFFLVKKIPLTSYYMGYAPKVNFNVKSVDFSKLKEYCFKNKISFIRFDVPNIIEDSKNGRLWVKELNKIGIKAPRNTFTKKNIYMDLSKPLEEIEKTMHQKKRYNIKQALKKGVKIKIEQDEHAFENFWKLHSLTAKNQGFLIHSKEYFKTVYNTLGSNVHFVQGFIDNEVASCWMIIFNGNTIYYIYGGSSPKYNSYFPNDLVGFEAIKLGKKLGATLFDMWGAEEGKGFTDFKLKYGGELVKYIPSYDLVINKIVYIWFNFIYEGFWKAVNLKKKLIR